METSANYIFIIVLLQSEATLVIKEICSWLLPSFTGILYTVDLVDIANQHRLTVRFAAVMC